MIEIVAETGSTSTELARRLVAAEPCEEGHWLVADRQSAGRGRQGRNWMDGCGNFMGSTLVRLRAADPPAHTLSLAAGVALFSAVQEVAPDVCGVMLKWPNDLLADDAKLAGILLERLGEAVVIGIGVNLALAPEVPGRTVTSLGFLGHWIDRDAFAAVLSRCWDEALQLWHSGGWEELRRDWIVRAHPVGTPLAAHGGDGQMIRGRFAGLDPDGALQLQLAGGTRRTIHAGEVLLDRR